MINGELIVDNFAGGGGASTGIELATGYSVDIAINHDPKAIWMHKANHPNTKHYCEDVWQVDPVKACNGHPVGLAWFSPDCKHFSKAKGGKPKDKFIRGLAWVACRWAGLVRPRVIMLENVEEFKTWGPLNRGHHPIKAKQGKTFEKFVQQLTDLGYDVQFRELVAADYGAPTMRKRFFLIARCDGKPIVWPEPTHAPADSEEVKAGLLKPYVGAYTQLDFSLPCPSIFDTSEEIKEKYGIRAVRPLAPKTMERIARGLKKFVLENPEPFIIQCNHGGERRPNDIREPMPTITGKHGYGIVEPYMVQIGQTGFTADRSKDVRDPLTTIVSKNEHCLISPTLIQYHSETAQGEVRGQTIKEPIMTVDGSNRYGLVTSFLHKTNMDKLSNATRIIDERVITLDLTKLSTTEANGMITGITINQDNGDITVTYYSGATKVLHTLMAQIAINFGYDPVTEQLIIYLKDGTEQYIDMSALITQFEFLDSDTIYWTIGKDGKVKADIKKGSITADKLQPDYLADITVQAETATQQASAAASSAAQAKIDADRAESYAKITEPKFYLDETTMNLYMKDGAGVDFVVVDNVLYWKVA